jgi:peptide subunit release factor 1 (eRF1)
VEAVERVRQNTAVIVRERLRELARFRPEGHKVLSLYVNLDPSEFPTPRDRSVELESLLDVVEGSLREDSLEHAQREELKRDLERVRAYFAREFDAKGTRGVVVFCASGAGLFEVVRLPRPISSGVVIDDSPFIEPLTTLPGADGYCVLLINRQVARILVGGAERMREVANIVDDVHGWHDQGGWSQARYQRGIVKETRDHVKHAADELFRHFKQGTVQRLIIGAPDELRSEIEARLHSYLRERIVGRIDIDVRSSPAAVAKEVAEIIERDERERERAWLDRLQSELGRNARGVAGLADTLNALNERRVEAILLHQGFRAEGWATPGADFLATEPGSSPSGEQLQKRDDVIEAALESALEQSAEVVVVRHHRDLQALGSIGAVLRY